MNWNYLRKQEIYANKKFRERFNKKRHLNVKANSWHDVKIRNEVELQWTTKNEKTKFENDLVKLHEAVRKREKNPKNLYPKNRIPEIELDLKKQIDYANSLPYEVSENGSVHTY